MARGRGPPSSKTLKQTSDPPSDFWYRSIVDLISYLNAHGADYEKLKATVAQYPPKHGWDKETEEYVGLAIRLSLREPRNELP